MAENHDTSEHLSPAWIEFHIGRDDSVDEATLSEIMKQYLTRQRALFNVAMAAGSSPSREDMCTLVEILRDQSREAEDVLQRYFADRRFAEVEHRLAGMAT